MTALYSPEAMVDLMIAEPHITPKQLAMRFGRPRSWLSSVLASEDFQAALAPRRSEISNPAFTASLRERFAALAIAAGDVLMERMDREGEYFSFEIDQDDLTGDVALVVTDFEFEKEMHEAKMIYDVSIDRLRQTIGG